MTESDCQCLHSFFSGNGDIKNGRRVVEMLSSRNSVELKLVRQTYHALYNQDLLHLPSQNRKSFYRAAYLLMSEPHERDAEILRRSLCSARVEGNTLIEIICTRTLTDLNLIKQAYRARYNSELEQEITSRTGNSTSFKEALVAILSSIRYDGVRTNTSMAMCDAKMIFEAMECGKSIDRKTILSLISSRSREQLRAIFVSFKQLYGHELSKSLKRERFGEFGKEVQRIIRCVQFPDKYLSKQLRMALKNGDAKEVLIRIVIARVGIDIKNINSAFAAKTGWSLESLIRTEFCNGIEIDPLTADLLIRLLQFS